MNIFQIKSQPHGVERLDLFLSQGYICIGYPGIGDLLGVNKDEIRDRLNNKYGWTGSQLGTHLGIVNAFVNTMEKDDIVLVKENDWVHIGRVDFYQYDSNFESEGMCHRRDVKWLVKVKRDRLNAEIRELLSNRSILTKYKYLYETSGLEEILSVTDRKENIDGKYNDIISRSIEILTKSLDSNDEQIRVNSATALLNYFK